jgi:cysteine desulfurase
MNVVYLDYNRTTPLAGAVRQAMLPFLDDFYAAPGNPHWQSRAVEEAIEDARSMVAALMGCSASEIVFTSGGTESTNLALLGAARVVNNQAGRSRRHAIISRLEHRPVAAVADFLATQGWDITRLPSNTEGFIDPDDLAKALKKQTRLVSIQLANGYLGTRQKIADLTRIPRPEHCLFHTDATQAFGKLEVDVGSLGVDLLSLSGHRMYAAKGVGALYIRHGVHLESWMHGGWEENGLRPGLLNTASLVGLGVAAQLVKAGEQDVEERLSTLHKKLWAGLRAETGDALRRHGSSSQALPNTACFSLGQLTCASLLAKMPELHLGVPWNTNFISANTYDRSCFHAIGLDQSQAHGILCASLGWNTTEDEIDRAIGLISQAYRAAICS